MSDDDTPAPYSIPAGEHHPGIIAARLLQTETHKHIADNEIRIDYLMTNEGVFKAGKTVIGAVHLPTVQGRLKSLFEQLLAAHLGGLPDFLMVIDAVWWDEASPIDREALVWHERCHVQQEIDKYGELKFDQDGNPKYALRDHDVAAFNSEVERYGAWSDDLQQFLAAARK